MQNKIWFHCWADNAEVKSFGFCTDEKLQFVLDAAKEQEWMVGKQFAIAKEVMVSKGIHGVKVGEIKYN